MTILSPTRTTPNFNPRTPRGVRRGPSGSRTAGGNISIHAPRAGRDSASMTHFFASPLFQSTRPMRGATVGPGDIPAIEKPFQSTHPMRGATSNTPRPPIDHGISIHAPHAGRDLEPPLRIGTPERFQSTRPMRGATAKRPIGSRIARISIHAPHAGRDAGDKYITGSNCISIHAPLAGCDVEHIQHTVWFSPYFNPRAPCGARQGDHLGGTPLRAISIHAPRAGRDQGV